MQGYLVFFYIVVTIVAVSATDYCAMNCTVDGKVVKHSACGYDGKFASECSKNFTLITISDDLKQVILDAHNTNRELIPNVHFRNKIQYNDELAKLADIWARQCKGKDVDPCHPTESFPSSIQALYRSLPHLEVSLKPIQIIEVLINNMLYNNEPMMIIDRSTYVGCALSRNIGQHEYRGKFYMAETWAIICNYSGEKA